MLKSPLFWKIVTLGGAIVLLLIPLMMVRQIIVERADYRDAVEDAIRQSTSGPQKVVGPLIAVPVTELYTVLENEKEVQHRRSFIHFWLPESLMVESCPLRALDFGPIEDLRKKHGRLAGRRAVAAGRLVYAGLARCRGGAGRLAKDRKSVV